ncbi:MAG: short-chain dehydrogenase/reductase SDR [Alphaproteobacteria bacterium]|nr:MAG: short-chain dehydrogenase/reductase SDR [Caulobacteraceae bacterium]TPW03400.1 MAG: short-chain dehydrogenase/reductase SDR [Alphaproteobacteria bacterium]
MLKIAEAERAMVNKIVVVTGANGALGSAVIRALAAAGVTPVGVDQTSPAHDPSVVESRAWIEGGVDLTDADAARRTMQAIVARFGRIDGLVNVAGAFRWETLESGAADTWDFMFRVNLATAVNACRAALPHLLAAGGGSIVNVGAGAAIKAGAGMGPYAASKSGVHRLTESLAEELKGKVTVNAVLPSIIDTPTNRKDMPDADFSTWVTTAEIADVILFLVSQKARGVTGALIPVSGRV